MTELPPPVAAPCNECPWRRTSTPGWLGPYTAKDWLRQIHGEGAIACHKTIKKDQSWEGASQCAGAASFRANVCKQPRDPAVACGPGREDVFSSNQEFLDHHTSGRETWELGDLYADDSPFVE